MSAETTVTAPGATDSQVTNWIGNGLAIAVNVIGLALLATNPTMLGVAVMTLMAAGLVITLTRGNGGE